MINFNILVKLMIYLFFTILISCTKNSNNDKLYITICNKNIHNDDRIKIKISNYSENNYFIILDTVNYYDPYQNYKTNESIRPKQIFFIGKDSLQIKILSNADKQIFLDTSNINCNKIKRKQSTEFIEKFKKLGNIIVLKKKSITNLYIPFSVSYKICDKKFEYVFDKNKHFSLMLKYNMKKSFIDDLVHKEKLKELNKKGILPFYGVLNSNKVNLIIN